MKYTLNPDIQKYIDLYMQLPIENKQVVCPYYINSKVVRGELGVLAGKGLPHEIVHELKVWAKVRGFDLENASGEQIRKFMIKTRIGIDCSGFVVNVLNQFLKEKFGKSLISFLKFRDKSILGKIRRFLRPIENIGAEVLTSTLNCSKVENINEVRPGDLIRAKGTQSNANHVAIVSEVELDDNLNVVKIVYVNSHRFYGEDNGIRVGNIDIIDSSRPLEFQKWNDVGDDGANYILQDYLVEVEDNGIRRLHLPDNILVKFFN